MNEPNTLTPGTNWCASMSVHHRLLDTDSDYATARRDIEDSAFEWIRSRRARRDNVITIPVVVHVVWHDRSENISNGQIHSQIEVLNNDFRKKNKDIDTVPKVWQDITADVGLEFALATYDPQGIATTGINRVETTVESFGAEDDVKSSATGGADAWPADRYLNIWVCRLRGGLLGYAQFPGGPPATDGVVITHRGFGANGTATAPFDQGRTCVHEIGHWLNLRHIWGDDGEGCSGDDFVDDTPNQGGPSSGVPLYPSVSCDNGPHGDMFMNFMDYSNDAVTVMFTQGQAARMDACLESARSSFLEPEATAS